MKNKNFEHIKFGRLCKLKNNQQVGNTSFLDTRNLVSLLVILKRMHIVSMSSPSSAEHDI